MQMQINLKGHVVIFDEAHNIEDICRDAASVSIKSSKIAKAAEDCEILSKNNHMYFTIYKYLQDFEKFVNSVDVDENSNVRTCSSDRSLLRNFAYYL